ncbi:MAG: helix-turn-helix domain-containing protein [Candidatus Flemingiibacterium sp.]
MNGFYEPHHDVKGINIWIQRSEDISAHFHNSIEFVYVKSGCLDIVVDNRFDTITAGQMMTAASGSVHSIYSHCGGEYYCLIIPRDEVSEWKDELDGYVFGNTHIDDTDGNIFILIKSAYELKNAREKLIADFNDEYCMKLMRLIIASLLGLVIPKCTLIPRRRMTDLVAAAVDHILKNYRGELSLKRISKDLLANSQLLSKQFREVMGMTIVNYIKSLRASEMKRLLTGSPGLSVEEAAELAGFSSMRSMYRSIREVYGCTPNKLRHSVQSRPAEPAVRSDRL